MTTELVVFYSLGVDALAVSTPFLFITMARFNKTVKERRVPDTKNFAGGRAYSQPAELELVGILLSSFLDKQYYRSGNKQMNRLIELVKQVDPLFAAKAAIYARDKFHMRSVTHVVAGEIALSVKGEQWTKSFFEKIVQRPDDILEVISYLKAREGRIFLPAALRKGFGAAMSNMDEYRLAKYRGSGRDISLIDAVNLIHPSHTDALGKLMNGTLSPAETWEVKLTQAGSDKSKKADAWADMVLEGKIGYMALLRNLRNILTQAPELTSRVASLLRNEKKCLKSKILPFRIHTAAEEIGKLGHSQEQRVILAALSDAFDIACSNVPSMDGRSLVAVDVSGSMTWNERPITIASLFAGVLAKAANADILLFDTRGRYFPYNPANPAMTIAQSISKAATGGGTDFNEIFRRLDRGYDRIFVLSDMQGWVGGGAPRSTQTSWMRATRSSPYIYSFDLTGSGTTQFYPDRKLVTINGFSNEVFKLISHAETDRNVLVNEIKSITI